MSHSELSYKLASIKLVDVPKRKCEKLLKKIRDTTTSSSNEDELAQSNTKYNGIHPSTPGFFWVNGVPKEIADLRTESDFTLEDNANMRHYVFEMPFFAQLNSNLSKKIQKKMHKKRQGRKSKNGNSSKQTNNDEEMDGADQFATDESELKKNITRLLYSSENTSRHNPSIGVVVLRAIMKNSKRKRVKRKNNESKPFHEQTLGSEEDENTTNSGVVDHIQQQQQRQEGVLDDEEITKVFCSNNNNKISKNSQHKRSSFIDQKKLKQFRDRFGEMIATKSNYTSLDTMVKQISAFGNLDLLAQRSTSTPVVVDDEQEEEEEEREQDNQQQQPIENTSEMDE